MDYIQKRELTIPATAKKIEFNDIKYTAYVWPTAGKYSLKIFGGRRAAADIHRYCTKEEASNIINKYIQERYANAAAKEARKLQNKQKQQEAFKNVKVGDIFYTSWGYDQTNVDFYKLIELKGKTGTFQELSSEVVEGTEGYMSCEVIPGETFIGEPFKSRFTGDVATQMPYGQRGHKTKKNTSHYSSWYA